MHNVSLTFISENNQTNQTYLLVICVYILLCVKCTREDTLTHILGASFIDDAMRYNMLMTLGTSTP